LETFKYHQMTFRGGGREGFAQTVIWWKGVWPNRLITFIVAKKAKFTVYLALFTVYVGGGVG